LLGPVFARGAFADFARAGAFGVFEGAIFCAAWDSPASLAAAMDGFFALAARFACVLLVAMAFGLPVISLLLVMRLAKTWVSAKRALLFCPFPPH
jgi:hypothetical protein